MQNRVEQHHQSPREVPPVGRPRGATWRSIQADGVVWEGQVLLVGGDVDLAARMIVTHRRVVFVRGGETVLEVPRGWLRQEPLLRRDGVLELFVATPDSGPFDEPMRVPMRMREGHPAAGHIIAMLAPGGVRRIAPEAMSAFERARESAAPAAFDGFWDGVEGVSGARKRQDLFAGFGDSVTDASEPDSTSADMSQLVPIEPPERLVRAPSTAAHRPATNPYPIAGMLPRDQRRSPWTMLLRIAALTILLGTAAALGAGRLNLQLPGLGGQPVLTAPSPTVTAASEPMSAGSESDGAALSPDELTAVAVGVGGPDETAEAANEPDNAVAAATEIAEPTSPAIAATEVTIPTPAPATAPDSAPTGTDATQASDATAATTPDLAQEAATRAAPAASQGIMAGPLRVTLSTAYRDESLPKYGLPPGSGEWVLVLAEVTNEGDDTASIPMSDFRLLDRGSNTVATLDTGTDVIASLAGLKPARGASDVIAVDPGASAETLLLYLLPTGSSDDLVLLAGDDEIDLESLIATGAATPAMGSQVTYLPSRWRTLENRLTP